jgi:dihydropyrimidine dehydrogenase (NAD+) subunit PreT
MSHSQGPLLAELLPPLSDHEALVEANRCIYCYDAPCTHACPTHIDIPAFIKKIASGNKRGSARTILEANLLGATCARVCPVQELCEGACVLGAEHKPIMIGRLQRYAMDYAYDGQIDVFSRAASEVRSRTTGATRPVRFTGRRIAVVGAGAAGLSCAGELARRGHAVTVFEKRELGGGLSTYGIIVLREPVKVALAEIEMIRRLGVEFRMGVELCRDVKASDLQTQFDAVFLSTGLGGTPRLGIPGEGYIVDGLAYIEQSKLDPARLHVGRRVVVIGAGNTAIDCATVAKRLGAEQVTMLYRRTESEVSAYEHEMQFIRNEGVEFRFLTQPVSVQLRDGQVIGLECVRMSLGEWDASGRRSPVPVAGSEFFIAADQVVKAIGQEKPPLAAALGLKTKSGYIEVNRDFETSIAGVFAGGDCVRAYGACSTVMAVEDGKLAAAAIHRRLAGS